MEFKTIDQLKPGDPVYKMTETMDGLIRIERFILVKYEPSRPGLTISNYARSIDLMKAGIVFSDYMIQSGEWYSRIELDESNVSFFSDINGLKFILEYEADLRKTILSELDSITESVYPDGDYDKCTLFDQIYLKYKFSIRRIIRQGKLS